MFHMMNEARLNVGMGAAMLGVGRLRGLARLRPGAHPGPPGGGRRQGRPLAAGADHLAPGRAAHAAGAEVLLGGRARPLPLRRPPGRREAHRRRGRGAAEAGILLELLTPVAKSWPSQWCLEANSLAIQVLGGYGYTRDFPVEQYWRRQPAQHDPRGDARDPGARPAGPEDPRRRRDGAAALGRPRRGDGAPRPRAGARSRPHAEALAARLAAIEEAVRTCGRTSPASRCWPAPATSCRPSATPWSPGSGSTWRCAAAARLAGEGDAHQSRRPERDAPGGALLPPLRAAEGRRLARGGAELRPDLPRDAGGLVLVAAPPTSTTRSAP